VWRSGTPDVRPEPRNLALTWANRLSSDPWNERGSVAFEAGEEGR
jgi:hypothetical protein